MQLGQEQYLVDSKGRKKAVVMPIKRYEQLQDDLHDLAIVAARRAETPITLDELKRRLKKA
jgi:PHD/YefM family antitoxin component YafN of YafNO toxin-antitoxin module